MADNRFDEAVDIIARFLIRPQLSIEHPTGGNVLDLPIQAIVNRAIEIYTGLQPAQAALDAAFDYLTNHHKEGTPR